MRQIPMRETAIAGLGQLISCEGGAGPKDVCLCQCLGELHGRGLIVSRGTTVLKMGWKARNKAEELFRALPESDAHRLECERPDACRVAAFERDE